MAIIEVRVPQLSESVAEATLLDWHKKGGEQVARDENLIDIETDKVVLELPAPAEGVLVKILKNSKGLVTSGEVIATIDTEGKVAEGKPIAAAAGSAAAAKPAPSAPAKAPPPVMPAAQKIASEKGIDTSQILGSGRDGRVTKADVLDHAARPRVAPAPAAAPAGAPAAKPALPQPPSPVQVEKIIGNRPEQRVPMSRLRQRVAERLVQSQSTAAILTTFNEVNMAPVIELRNRYKDRFEKEYGVKLGFMGFFIKAAVHALKKFPAVNASIDGADIVYNGYF